ncbi:2-keto-4-pentenoate hydratase [Fusibacter ferrireducens]|uniref:2-keto-4-pentenoate hydratase n=1 Tax=Fusibacter ferrireducens TaxID=2785058 RepID=A0ABR9ZSP3_9FIRM|nr:2-keto-4-pentenoate hydratase [Fusibacter ferrireducens]MBF4693493.1 2-keto-4-pentenoate hydratase [Fusibacter ferrireducens]
MGNRLYSNADLAHMLMEADRNKRPIEALTALQEGLTLDDAYEIQMINVQKMLASGEVISGKKIGLTSLGMQKLLGVDEPDYGHLYESMNLTTGNVPKDFVLQPKVEAEIAFVLKEDLIGPNVTVEDVYRATDYIVAAFEIVGSRIKNWKIKLVDTISDNASSGCYVLSEKRYNLNDFDLKTEKMKFYKNGELANEGTGAEVMGDPVYSVAWLANKMSEYGVELKKGEIILSGALTAALTAEDGDEFEAVFENFGSVKIAF